ncbi:hypothetical protein [Maridesulfovibrio sp.]|uniref:hypothetical protein n=1 Tax=Maridesulfovibrio sp. TaxID=2795000 RepID=UPI0029C9C8E9|nr:hypothetical protein [Maridesulfovibrio sp.]
METFSVKFLNDDAEDGIYTCPSMAVAAGLFAEEEAEVGMVQSQDEFDDMPPIEVADSSIVLDHKSIDGEVRNAVLQKVLSGVAPGKSGEITVFFGKHKFLVRVIPFRNVCPDLDSGTATRIYADVRCEVVEDAD